MANKKGLSQVMEILISIILALVLLLAVIAIFFPNLFTFGDVLRAQQNYTVGDPDFDGVAGLSDDCPCTYGEIETNGCPAEFTSQQKQADREKYNSDTGCGVLKTGTEDEKITEKVGEEAFMHYESLEIFGDDDSGEKSSGTINFACPHWMGLDCPTQGNDCDDDEFSYQPITKGCWIMASEEDAHVPVLYPIAYADKNDCGQYAVDEETIVSATKSASFEKVIQEHTFFSADNEEDPQNLFRWQWRSKPNYGSLICKGGFWFGCKQGNEGKELIVSNKIYGCIDSEWIRK